MCNFIIWAMLASGATMSWTVQDQCGIEITAKSRHFPVAQQDDPIVSVLVMPQLPVEPAGGSDG